MQFCPIAENPGNQVKPFGDFCDPLFLWDMLYLILVFVCMYSCARTHICGCIYVLVENLMLGAFIFV